MDATAIWITLGLLVAAVGLVGTVMPALPGTGLVLAGLGMVAWADGFQRVGWGTLAVLAVLALASFVLEYLAGLMGARKAGASRLALVGAALGTVAGLLLGFVGVLFMPLVGAALGEYLAQRDHGRAMNVGLSTWVGLMLGMLAKVVLACTMVGVFAVAWFW